MSTPIFDALMAESDDTTRTLVRGAIARRRIKPVKPYVAILSPGFLDAELAGAR